MRLTAAATSMVLGIQADSAGCHAATAHVTQEYRQEIERVANIPEIHTTTAGWTLSSTEAGYLTEIAHGVTISFMCRQKGCLFFGKNDQWIKHVESEHFRCPQCGERYRPWSFGKGEFPAQKVLHVVDPVTQVDCIIPCTWPGSDEDKWLNNMVEIRARDIQTDGDLRAFMERSAVNLSELLTKVGTPLHFMRLEWNPEIESAPHTSRRASGHTSRTKECGA